MVMILTGVLRHYATVLMATTPKKPELAALKEQRSLMHGVAVRSNHYVLTEPSFKARREYLTTAYESGAYLRDPERRGQPPANPMTDPGAMDGMMGMMKNNMAMIVPNTLIMSWINAFFSGFVILKLPFPLTIKFKSMLQAGVATKDMDPRWMSSISWYFLCYFGLQFVFNFLLGSDNGKHCYLFPLNAAPSLTCVCLRPSCKPDGPADAGHGPAGPQHVRARRRPGQAVSGRGREPGGG